MLIDLNELKATLEIDPRNKSEDKRLNFFIEMVTDVIEEWTDRKGKLFYKSGRVEYYDGTGTQLLLLRARPVYLDPAPVVKVNETAFYDSADFNSVDALTFNTDYTLRLDQEEEPRGRSGILIRNYNIWPRPAARAAGLLSPFVGEGFGSIQVTYTAGYTLNDMPAGLRMACMLAVARLRNVMPLGQELGSESYLDRGVSYVTGYRNLILSVVKPYLIGYRNWNF